MTWLAQLPNMRPSTEQRHKSPHGSRLLNYLGELADSHKALNGTSESAGPQAPAPNRGV